MNETNINYSNGIIKSVGVNNSNSESDGVAPLAPPSNNEDETPITLTTLFKECYPEFNPLEEIIITNMIKKVKCLYTQFSCVDINSDCYLYPFFMLVAHYLVINGYGSRIGVNGGGGLIASSSIDSVSVTYQVAPFKDNFQYFFSQTKYGQEYLTYLSTRSGIMLVN